MRFERQFAVGLLRALPLLALVVMLSQSHVNRAQDADAIADAPGFWADLFTYQNPETVLDDRNPEDVIILATGDVLLARTINVRMTERNDFTFPFANVKDFLARGDITWVNLETPLVTDCPLRWRSMRFCGDPRGVAALLSAGVDVANMANNHAENHGEDGVLETEQILTDAGIEVTGRAKPVIIEIHGKTIGLLGFNDIGPTTFVTYADPETIEAQVRSLRDQVDYVIVQFHWGVEYKLMQNRRQRNLAKVAIDAGADVVVGMHPHWVEGVEVYDGKPIIYSLGNFIFDQKEGGWVNEGAIALINLKHDGTLAINFLPVIIEKSAIPRFADEEEAGKILRRMASVSSILEE